LKKSSKNFIKKAEYPGGNKALQKFIAQNLKYPKAALIAKVEGFVLVKYSVDFNGMVVECKALNSLGHGCDDEAERVVSMLKYEPQKNRNMKVSTKHKLKINFKLPPSKSLKYNITKAKTANSNKNDTGETFGYTINI